MSYEPQQPRPDYRGGNNSGYIPPQGGAPYPGAVGGSVPPQHGPYAGGPSGPGGPVPPVGTPYHGGPGGSSGPQDDERTVAIVTHLSGLVAALVSAGSLGFLGPLVVWLIYKDKSPFLRSAAAGSFNFNASMWLINTVGWICIASIILLPVGLVLVPLYWVMMLVCHIVAMMRANQGRPYRYPLQLPILR